MAHTTGPTYNPLLQKDDIGRAKPTCYDLPGSSFAYGRAGNRDAEGAKEVSMYWCGHVASTSPRRGAPDFIRLHRKAANAAITTPRDLAHYRREHDISLSMAQPTQGLDYVPLGSARINHKVTLPSDLVPGFTYGKKCRPSTPIREIISNRWGAKVKSEMQQLGQAIQRTPQVEVRKIPFTNASRGHASAAKKAAMQIHGEKEQIFKISKFLRVPAKIKTNRRLIGQGMDPNCPELVDVENEIAQAGTEADILKETADFPPSEVIEESIGATND